MNYLKEKCAACEKIFTQSDDIVVCPYCGTPHHRECYNDLGHCKNQELHAQGFEWSPTCEEAVSEPVTAVNDGHQIIFCPNCGKENPASEPVCVNCGQRLYNNAQPDFVQQPIQLPNMQNQQFATNVIQISPDDTIGGNKVSDTAEYIQMNTHRYIPKFYKMEKTGNKLSFNWAAFFFSPYWFFFRKMHIIGFVIMLLTLLVTGACTTDRMVAASEKYYNAVEQYYADEISYEQLAEASGEIVRLPEVIIETVFGLAVKIFCGAYGNYLYKKKVEKDISDIKSKADTPETYRFMLFKRGGVSGLMCVLSIVGYYCAEQILSALLSR